MRKKIISIITILVIVSMLFTGCNTFGSSTSSSIAGTTATQDSTFGSKEATTSSDSSDVSANDTVNAAITLSSSNTSNIVVDTEFTAKDLEVGYDETIATSVILSGNSIEVSGEGAEAKGSVLTISKEGTYVISGTLNDGQVIVNTEDGDKVQLVLAGAAINCSDNAPIYIKNADKVFITLADGSENTLTDGSAYVQNDENTVDGVIFSKADLTINGNGTLNIEANYKHGIVSKDDLNITGGTFRITAAKDAINGKDCVKIKAGTFHLSAATGNGIQSKNAEDTGTGYVYIYGGDITITGSVEGIEATAIVIVGGNIDITASDDGLNTSSGDTQEAFMDIRGGFSENDANCYISISGGTVTVNAAGDGLDSNGSLYISGGTVYVNGPVDNGNAGMDYNGAAEITGGTVVVAGSAGMAQNFSDTSTQYSILNNLTTTLAAGSEVTLTDSEGNVLFSFTPEKTYSSILISTPELANGETYTLTCGTEQTDITITSIATTVGVTGMMGGGGRMDKNGIKRP